MFVHVCFAYHYYTLLKDKPTGTKNKIMKPPLKRLLFVTFWLKLSKDSFLCMEHFLGSIKFTDKLKLHT